MTDPRDAITLPPNGSHLLDRSEQRSEEEVEYEAHGVVGTGAMGLVHLVRDRRLGRMVALKTIDRDLALDPGLLARFVTEVQVTAGAKILAAAARQLLQGVGPASQLFL